VAFKLLTVEEARAFGLQIINAYKQGHDLPIVGSGVILPVTPERAKNKNKQSVYRAKTPRLTIWMTDDYANVTAGLADKIYAIGIAKKQWRAAIGVQHRHERELTGFLNRTISLTVTSTNTAARIAKRIEYRNTEIARLQASIQLDINEVQEKFDLYEQAIS
jgi:hypothetical protein